MAELIEMLFGSRSPMQRTNFEGGKAGPSAMRCAKTAELIEMLFRIWTRVGPRTRVLDGVHIGATW